ncbi:MAG: ATP-binding protein [Clostridia bacterium]|nr:ATP-binding protein [Clostridia bacterium]
MYTRDNYREAKAEIEARRTSAVALAEERCRELATASPEIKRIDEELRGTGLELFRVACSGGDISAVRKRNEALIAARRAELVRLGLPEDYTEVKYACPICSDTGFVGTKMCSCLKELLITKNIKSSGMGKLIERQSFENFSLEGIEGEDRERMEKNLAKAKAYAELFPKCRGNLLLIGTTGTGKTHISTAIAKEIIHQGFDVVYDSVQNIISDFESDKFKSNYGQGESLSEKYLECELLIIDDLGTEFSTQFSTSTLYNLLNTRQNRGLATIISTNLSAKELAGKYDGRIYSRIVGSDYTVLFFSGKDYRIR